MKLTDGVGNELEVYCITAGDEDKIAYCDDVEPVLKTIMTCYNVSRDKAESMLVESSEGDALLCFDQAFWSEEKL